MFDAIMDSYWDFNTEALATKVDLLNLADEVKSSVLNEYILIQSGKKPMTNEDYNKEITEVIAERLDITLEECESELIKAIELVMSQNYRQWFRYYLNYYKGEFVNSDETNSPPFDDLDGWEDIDFRKKHLWKRNIKQDEIFPDELNELLEYREDNLSKLQWYQSRGRLTEKQHKKLKFLKRNQIEIDKDISEAKRSFNIPINNNNQHGRSERVSFDDSIDQAEPLNTYDEKTLDSMAYHKVIKIADKVLTDKQRVIFYLYFESNLSQSEISQIIDDNQGNISRALHASIEKIKKELSITYLVG